MHDDGSDLDAFLRSSTKMTGTYCPEEVPSCDLLYESR